MHYATHVKKHIFGDMVRTNLVTIKKIPIGIKMMDE